MMLPDPLGRPARDDVVFPGGIPLACDLTKSSGAYLADARTGKEVLDFIGHATGGPLGYNHPRLKDEEFLENLKILAMHMPVNCETHNSEYSQFSETFDIVPLGGQFANLLFVKGEFAAIETALKTAIAWKQQKNILAKNKRRRGGQILHFRQGFQSRLGLALSLTELFDNPGDQWAPRLKWPRVENPVVTFPLDDDARVQVEEAEKRVLGQIDAAYERAPGEIAAILIEPIQAEGGDNFFRAEFLRALRDICDERDSLLIFDETLTGFGVTGKWWDWQNHDVKPDLMVFGGRAQVCGVAATERLDEVGRVLQECADSSRRFAGDLINMVRSQRTIEIIRDLELLTNAVNMGIYLNKLLTELPNNHPEVTNVRGRGVWAAFDLPTEEERDRVVWACFEEELLVGAAGERAVRLRPGLDVNADAVGRAIAQLEAGLRRAYNRRV